MIAGVASAVTQVENIVHDLEAIHFRLLGVQAYLPPGEVEVDLLLEKDATEPATILRTAIACVIRDNLAPALRALEEAMAAAGSWPS